MTSNAGQDTSTQIFPLPEHWDNGRRFKETARMRSLTDETSPGHFRCEQHRDDGKANVHAANIVRTNNDRDA